MLVTQMSQWNQLVTSSPGVKYFSRPSTVPLSRVLGNVTVTASSYYHANALPVGKAISPLGGAHEHVFVWLTRVPEARGSE